MNMNNFGADRPPEGLPSFLDPLRCLGEGGMGAVWSVLDRRTGEIGALKAIRPSLLTDSAIVRRFEREMRTIAQLNHPGIVQVLDVGRLTNNAPYLLMEQVNGVPLIDLDIQGRTLGELVRLFDRILAALAYAHARRIIHRDFKPDNVLVITDELGELHPKLMDFGLAMVAVKGKLTTRLTADGMVVGTPAYMAPEQACDEHYKISPATDLYAFGCMLYELLSGTPPHVASSPMALLLAHATRPPRPFIPLPSLPSAARLDPLIMRLLAKDPIDRFEFAADVRVELRESGLMKSSEAFDADPLGPYGDTLLGMSRPDFAGPAIPRAQDDPVSSPQMGGLTPSITDISLHTGTQRSRVSLPTSADAMMQISVLNFHEPHLVGRAEELNTLHRYVEDVRGANQVALCRVSGPRGIGKSRLVRWLVEDGEGRGALRYLRVSLAGSKSVGLSVLQAFVDHLRLRKLPPNHTEQALMRFFRVNSNEDWRVRGFFDLVNSSEGQTPKSSTLGRLDLLLYAAIEQLSIGRPLALWLDETHDAPASQVAKFLRGLCARQSNRPCPVLVIVVDRAESDAPTDLELALGKVEEAWLRPGIHLIPLNDEETYELTHEGLNLNEPLAQHVVKLASGSPLLAVALARHWHVAGLLERTPEGFAYGGDVSLLPVPDAIQNIFSAQLSLAFGRTDPARWQPLAELAAVMGDVFSAALLAEGARHLPTQVPLVDNDTFLERAIQSGLIRSSSSAESTFLFTNSLMREGLLSRLPSDRLADLHRAAAMAKQRIGGGNSTSLRIEVAQHHLIGRTFALAYESFVAAANELVTQNRFEEALYVLDAAQQALAAEQGVSGPWDERMAIIWGIELDIALARQDFQSAQARVSWLKHVSDRLGEPFWLARAMRAEGSLHHRSGDLQRAAQLLDQAENLSRGLTVDHGGDAKPRRHLELGHVLLARAETSLALKEHDAIAAWATEAEQIALRFDSDTLRGRALMVQGLVALIHGDAAQAAEHLHNALPFSHNSGDLRTEASIYDSLADAHLALNDISAAEHDIEQASHCYEALGEFDIIAECHRRLADLARDQGRTADALAHERWQKLLSR